MSAHAALAAARGRRRPAGFAQSLAQREKTVKASLRGHAPVSDAGDELLVPPADVWSGSPPPRLRYSRALSEAARPDPASHEQQSGPFEGPARVLHEHILTVRPGDSLYTLFEARDLARADLAAIMAVGKATRTLARLRPGDRISVYTDDNNRVLGLGLERVGGQRLDVARDGDSFRAGVEARPANAVVAAETVRDNSNDWQELHKPPPALERRTVLVGNGDSLYSIFKKHGFQLADLAAIVKASKDTRRLARLAPGQRIDFHLTPDDGVSA